MRKLLIFLFLFPAGLFAQKAGVWVNDTFPVYFANNPCIDRVMYAGKLEQKDSATWWLYPDTTGHDRYFKMPVRIYRTDAHLFGDCVYFDLGAGITEAAKARSFSGYRVYPGSAASLRFYTTFFPVKTTYRGLLAADSLSPAAARPYYQPFYFRKYEVSNAEYREFISWVLDSVAHVQLGWTKQDGTIDRSRKIDWLDTSVTKKLKVFLPYERRFWRRKEIDPLVLTYKFAHPPAEFGRDTLNIYPDTLSWEHDFTFYWNEPMTNMYCWHPVYGDYPVAGVTYWQCLAFLEWKSKQLEQELAKKGKRYRVVCALPSEREWDMASTSEQRDGRLMTYGEHYFSLCDDSWLTDLVLNFQSSPYIQIVKAQPEIQEPAVIYSRKKPERVDGYYPGAYDPYAVLRPESGSNSDLTSDGFLHTGPVIPEKVKALRRVPKKPSIRHSRRRKKYVVKMKEHNLAQNERYLAHTDRHTGICYLDGNVSEWMREDLDTAWRPAFLKHIDITPVSPMHDAFTITHSIEKYYYDKLPAHGKLVRGCNWYDERHSSKYGKNTAGMNAKTFEDPSKAHCTLGFRYVIYVYPY